MIQTLEELIALTEAGALASNYIADEILLRTPGCSELEIAQLREALPGLPASYWDVAAKVALPIVSIGYLQLAPGGLFGGTLFDRLTDANSATWPLWEFVDQHDLYHVADRDSSLYCVAREGAAHPGEVVRIDYEWGGVNPQPHRVAWSFEQLMLGYGRISEQAQAGRFGPDAVEAVLHSMREDFGLDDEQIEDWWLTADEVLSETLFSVEERNDPVFGVPRDRHERSEMDTGSFDDETDVVSIFPRQAPTPKYDYVAAVPEWPGWQREATGYGDLPSSQYWTKYDGQVYMLRQGQKGNPNPTAGVYSCFTPTVWIFALRGNPKPGNRNWTLRDVAHYALPNVKPGEEAREEVAAFRRRLPELLSDLPAKKK